MSQRDTPNTSFSVASGRHCVGGSLPDRKPDSPFRSFPLSSVAGALCGLGHLWTALGQKQLCPRSDHLRSGKRSRVLATAVRVELPPDSQA